MGTYDIIEFKCPECGKKGEMQTKVLGNCSLGKLKKGSAVYMPNCVMLLKEECEHCKRRIAVKILDEKIHSFLNATHADCEEMPFGEFRKL